MRASRCRPSPAAARPLGLAALVLVIALAGCWVSRRYQPSAGYERILYARAHRGIGPAAVRAAPDRYRQRLLVWTGVVTGVDQPRPGAPVRIVADHRAWNELEYRDRHGVFVRLWPHGEGRFACNFVPEPGTPAGEVARADEAIVAYGWPRGVDADGTVVLECPFVRTLPPGRYRLARHP